MVARHILGPKDSKPIITPSQEKLVFTISLVKLQMVKVKEQSLQVLMKHLMHTN